jgi:UDP-2,4-diacetamido-2,4,6-trideoxy-beta-L-altropyranose hydrolase
LSGGAAATARHVLLRADASESVGTGHLVRSRTLAEGLIARGWRATMATRDLPDGLAASLAEAGIAILPLSDASEDEPGEIGAAIGADAALVVGDHYGLGADWFAGMRRRVPGAALMAIDDLADRLLPVDLVLNQNLGASSDAYARLVPPGARILAGPSYALLRPEFAAARARGRTRDGTVERILVFISGADAPDVTSRAVIALEGIGCPVDVVVGAAYPHLAGLREIVAGQPGTRLHVNTEAMADLMDAADLAIGAASSASWERCTLGLPALLVTLADNQVAGERLLVEAGAAVSIGWHDTVSAADIERAVRTLRADPAGVAAMSVAAAAVTDGRGTERVVAEIESIVASRMEAR